MDKQLTILLIGRILTNFADSFYMIATIWYVKTLTDSPLLVGLTSAIAILPVTIQFLYGPMIDRFSKKAILYMAMFGQGLLVTVISILYYADFLWLPLLYIMMFLALSLSECSYPVESALIERLAPREKLTKVNSIFSFSYQTLDIICDAVSGILIAFVGLGVIYISNSLLLIMIGLMFLMYLKVPKSNKEMEKSTLGFFKQYREDFKDGFLVVKSRQRLLSIVFGFVVMNLLATMGLAMLPVISDTSMEYGFWLTAMSIGTLSGTILSSKVEKFPLNRVLPAVALWSGIFWLLTFLFNETQFVPYVFFALSWLGIGILSIFIQTMIQVNLPREHVGIGFAFISSLLGSLSPLGYFLGGVIGEQTSGLFLLMLSGTGYMFFTVYFLMNPRLKTIKQSLSVSFED
ncbi:MFS transporter [Bacillus salacetis]|nr:MFS transporter [Bacillus salacetis]